MERQMIDSAVTLDQIQQQLATVGNNIANVDTTGYKSRSANFSDLLEQQVNNIDPNQDSVDGANRLTPSGIRLGSGAKVGDTTLDMDAGKLQQTGNKLDFALSNDQQFFTVALNGTTAYTRAGDFNAQPDPQNAAQLDLLTKGGESVLGTNGQPIRLPAGYSDLQIDKAGVITAVMPSGARINAGRLGIVQINRPQLLESQGNSLFTLPNLNRLGIGINEAVQPVTAGDGSVIQGQLEGSNVDLSDEMTSLVDLERNYQMNASSISMSDQMSGLINGLLNG